MIIGWEFQRFLLRYIYNCVQLCYDESGSKEMTRKEQALRKIRRLESQLDTATDHRATKIETEICRLQQIYGITLDEIKGKYGHGISEEVQQMVDKHYQ